MIKPADVAKLLGKTMPFVWTKLALSLISVAIVAGFFGLGAVLTTVEEIPLPIGFVLMGLGVLFGVLVQYFVVRSRWAATSASHIAVLAEVLRTGQVPGRQLDYGFSKILDRMDNMSTFAGASNLVGAAIMQLQLRLQSVKNTSDKGILSALGKIILRITIKYITPCCIGKIFYSHKFNKPQCIWKSTVDALFMYKQSRKTILFHGLKATAIVMGMTLGIGFVICLLLVIFLVSFGVWWMVFALAVAVVTAVAIKRALLDSWVLAYMLMLFFSTTKPPMARQDDYSKLAAVSPAFKELATRAKIDTTIAKQPPPMRAPGRIVAKGTIFCPTCGAKNPEGTSFCGECHSQV